MKRKFIALSLLLSLGLSHTIQAHTRKKDLVSQLHLQEIGDFAKTVALLSFGSWMFCRTIDKVETLNAKAFPNTAKDAFGKTSWEKDSKESLKSIRSKVFIALLGPAVAYFLSNGSRA